MKRLLRLLLLLGIAGAVAFAVATFLRRRASAPAGPLWAPPAVDEDLPLEREIADAEEEGMPPPPWQPAVDAALDAAGNLVEPEQPAIEAILAGAEQAPPRNPSPARAPSPSLLRRPSKPPAMRA